MDWYRQLITLCSKHNIEPVIQGDRVVLICPRTPNKEDQERIIEPLPSGSQVSFFEAPKNASINTIKAWLGKAGAVQALFGGTGRHLELEVSGIGPGMEHDSQVWPLIADVLDRDGYWESWKVYVKGETIMEHNKKVAEELAKKNGERETIILEDEITNLKIDLETKSTEDIWKMFEVDS